jgi:2-methylisocitrate lyase-like PEP mutase family enzyme
MRPSNAAGRIWPPERIASIRSRCAISTIGRLVKALAAPVNINVRAGLPSVAELEALGVARASTASQVALMAMSTTRQIADDLRATGRFDSLAPAMAQADAQRLFTGPS